MRENTLRRPSAHMSAFDLEAEGVEGCQRKAGSPRRKRLPASLIAQRDEVSFGAVTKVRFDVKATNSVQAGGLSRGARTIVTELCSDSTKRWELLHCSTSFCRSVGRSDEIAA